MTETSLEDVGVCGLGFDVTETSLEDVGVCGLGIDVTETSLEDVGVCGVGWARWSLGSRSTLLLLNDPVLMGAASRVLSWYREMSADDGNSEPVSWSETVFSVVDCGVGRRLSVRQFSMS
jgi:hypothetical protein